MPEITTKRRGELVRGVFKILAAKPEGLPAKVVLEELKRFVPPTAFEQSTYPGTDARRYEKIVRFATIGSVKAGWLTKSKGSWSLTEEGREAFRKYPDPEAFNREQARLYRKWKLAQPPDVEAGPPDEYSVRSADAATALEEAEETAWAEIEQHVGGMNPYDFQQLVAELLEAMKNHVAWTAPPGPDGGFDILAYRDPLGIQGPRIKVQVRRRTEKSTVDAVRAFMATVADDDVGIFVSTSGFTKDAQEEARLQQKRRIMLVHLEKLVDLWIEHYEELSQKARQLLLLRPVHYLAPSE